MYTVMVHINWTFLKLSFRSLFNYSDFRKDENEREENKRGNRGENLVKRKERMDFGEDQIFSLILPKSYLFILERFEEIKIIK